MTPNLWRRQSMLRRLWRCRNMPLRILTLHEHAHKREMMQHRLRIYNLSSFWRKLTSFRFQRHDVKRHHSEGRWCGSNFKAMKWHNLEERWCSLDLQGTRRCPQEISDAKHTSEMWENINRRWAMPWRLRLVFIFYYNDPWSSHREVGCPYVMLVNRRNLKSILMIVGKLFKLD